MKYRNRLDDSKSASTVSGALKPLPGALKEWLNVVECFLRSENENKLFGLALT